jgi:aryl-alcohol dehydrogenase-like predicted oxidoreductase
MFRQRPKELFFKEAKKKDIGVIVRVPLASGLLTGKFTRDTIFLPDDHRTFNRNGEAFDKGETFAGIDFNTGLDAVDELKKVFNNENLAQAALRWILSFDEVSTVIPGASGIDQLKSNVKASDAGDLTDEQKKVVNDIYNQKIKGYVHHLW